MNHTRKQRLSDCLVCFFTVTVFLTVIFKIYDIAPLGSHSLTIKDATIQYLDFFAYLKDVLEGKNNIFYTFGKTLGGTTVAVFSYYLTSPLNLLVYFFDKTELLSFFDIVVLIKLGLAAVTMNIYLNIRFHEQHSDTFSLRLLFYLLSVCYGLSQYAITQCNCIMWLDGMYMLPLIMLGVYKVIYQKSITFLSICTGLSILFNWYTGGINCVFTFVWLVFEYALFKSSDSKINISEVKDTIFRYAGSMFLGVCLSACLFLPTLYALRKSTRGHLDIKYLINPKLNGNIFSVIEAYSLGAGSSAQKVSLFCGSLALLGVLCLFAAKDIPLKRKQLFGALLIFTVLSYYWHPLFVVFSLFKDASSYYYRYSYLGIFVLLFTAAYCFSNSHFEENRFLPIKASMFWTVLLFTVHQLLRTENNRYVYLTILCLVIIGGLISLTFSGHDLKNDHRVLHTVLTAAILSECFYGTCLQISQNRAFEADSYKQYVSETSSQIDSIKALDNSLYRISQTSTRNTGSDDLTANYNESLAFNYWSISGYTSSPDDIQRNMLDRVGYRINGDNMCIVNTSLTGIDSLLGVKYVLSKYPIEGYETIDCPGTDTEKTIYLNPYAFPLAFTSEYCGGDVMHIPYYPFEYQNALFSQLLGKRVRLYIPVDFSRDLESDKSVSYTLNIPEGHYTLYGNLLWNSEFHGTMNINDAYSTAYACWLSPSAFYIPKQPAAQTAYINISSEETVDLRFEEEQFYALDLDKLSELTEMFQNRAADIEEMQNGRVSLTVTSETPEKLFISVPYDDGWSVKVNGQEVKTELFADCLFCIPLTPGTNNVLMTYHVKYQKLGILLSLLGITGIIILSIRRRKDAS